MKQGTPEQIQLLRHRRKVLPIVWGSYILIGFAALMTKYLLDLQVSPTLVKIFARGYVVGGAVTVLIFLPITGAVLFAKRVFPDNLEGNIVAEVKHSLMPRHARQRAGAGHAGCIRRAAFPPPLNLGRCRFAA